MSAEQHEQAAPRIEKTFAAVRAALADINVPAFDAHLEAILHAPVMDYEALDKFFAGWHQIATEGLPAAGPAADQAERRPSAGE